MRQLAIAVILAAVLSLNISAVKTDDMSAHSLSKRPLFGTLARETTVPYSRFPDSLKAVLRPEVWNLGLNSAGLAVRFASDATDIGAKWYSVNRFAMNHMTPTGIRGLDLYVLMPDSTWQTVGSARPSMSSHSNKAIIIEDMPRRMREYMLYLPLYDGVDSLFILTDSAATVCMPSIDLPHRDKPLIMYGTSILQGGCASRPGMVHTSIIGRMLNRDVINLGLSGNARLDPEVASYMAAADASLYVIDALPNCTTPILRDRMDAFIDIIRTAHPATPILLVESPMFPAARHSIEVFETLKEKNECLRLIYDRRKEADSNLYYMEADQILDDVEATVDNYHFTDLGFYKFARVMIPVIERILQP